MARQFEEDLRSAWKALTTPDGGEGYSYVPLSKCQVVDCYAARRFPEENEAIIISFPVTVAPQGIELPSGLGFEMRKENAENFNGSVEVFSVLCTKDGTQELFETFAADIISALDPTDRSSSKCIFATLISRLRSWQEFMKRPRTGLLTVEEQTGLFGELVFVKEMIAQSDDPSNILNSWVGPLRADQDFHIGAGAVEIKSTISSDGFPASIQSIGQLDDDVRQPLYIGTLKIDIHEDGTSLPMLVESLREHFVRKGVGGRFRARLEQSGYFNEHAEHYPRKLHSKNIQFLLVSDGFPRLTPASLGGVLLKAQYKIDIDRIVATRFTFEEVILALREQG